MRKKLLIFMIASLAIALGLTAYFFPHRQPAIDPIDQYHATQVDAVMEEFQKKYDIPGLAIAVVKNGKVLYERGYGVASLDTRSKVTPKTLFPIGSCTKAFTGLSLAILADRNKLQLNDPVIKHLPEFRMSNPLATLETNIVDLLAHRTGLGSHGMAYIYTDYSRQELLNRLPHLQMQYDLRDQFLYNNIMYAVAGIVTERVSGLRWEDFIEKEIFIPLEMTDSKTNYPLHPRSAALASPHLKIDGKTQVVPYGTITQVAPAGSLVSNARDMSKWLLFQLSDGSALISHEMFEETRSLQAGLTINHEASYAGFGYGLGWVIAKDGPHLNYNHEGYIQGFNSYVSLFPKDELGIAIMANAKASGVGLLEAALMLKSILTDSKAPDLNFEEVTEEIPHPVSSVFSTNLPLDAYAGSYFNPGYGTIVISIKNHQLVADINHIKYTFHDKCKENIIIATNYPEILQFDAKFTYGTDCKITALVIDFDSNLESIRFVKR